MKTDTHRIAREQILSELYSAFSWGSNFVVLNELCNQVEKTGQEVYKLLLELIDARLVTCVIKDGFQISPEGIVYVEQHRLAPEARVLENQAIREKILDGLASLHAVAPGLHSLRMEVIAEDLEADVFVVLHNAEVLQLLELIVPDAAHGFRISESGLRLCRIERALRKPTSEFGRALVKDGVY